MRWKRSGKRLRRVSDFTAGIVFWFIMGESIFDEEFDILATYLLCLVTWYKGD